MPSAVPQNIKRHTPAGILHTRVMPQSWDDATREIELCISTGAPGSRWDWRTGAEYVEELDVTGCDLTRLINAGSVLLDHDAEVENVIGRVLEGRVEDGAVIVRARLSSRPEMAGYVQDIRDGVIHSLSVGYTVEEEERITEEGQKERRVARRWTPWEVSFVAIPFDAGASTRSAEQPQQRQENPGMSQTQTPVAADPVVQPDMIALRKAETERQSKVRASAAKLSIAGEVVDEVINATATYEEAAAALLDRAAKVSDAQATVATHRAGATAYGATGQDAQMRGVVDALCARSGLAVDANSPMHTTIRERSLSGLLRQSLEARGVHTTGLTVHEMFNRSLAMARDSLMTRGGDVSPHTVSDFPTALEYLGKKIMMAAYSAEPLIFDQFAQRRDLTNLRAEKLLRIGAFPTPSATPEGGSIQYGTISDRGETYQAAKYTSGFTITEEAILNDDIGMMVDVMRQIGPAAVATQKGLFFQLFTSNSNTGPVMSDGNAFFSTAHANKGTAGAISATTIGELYNLLLSQLAEGQSDQYVYNEGRFLLVPAHYLIAAQTIISPNLIGSTSAVPDSLLKLKVLADPRLGITGNKPYYMVGQNSGLYYGYLADVPGPRMRQVIDQETLGVKLICDLFFACQVGDWKGVAQNPYGL